VTDNDLKVKEYFTPFSGMAQLVCDEVLFGPPGNAAVPFLFQNLNSKPFLPPPRAPPKPQQDSKLNQFMKFQHILRTRT